MAEQVFNYAAKARRMVFIHTNRTEVGLSARYSGWYPAFQ